MKKIVGFVVAIIILMMTGVFLQISKGIASAMLTNGNDVSQFQFVVVSLASNMLPLILGLWLVRTSWKKITSDNIKDVL